MKNFKVLCILMTALSTFCAYGANKLVFSEPPKESYAIGEKISFSWKHSERKAPTLLAIMKDGKRTTGLKLKKEFNSYSIPADSPGNMW